MPNPRLIIITPNWLSVDRAITFFRSFSQLAAIPAISRVRTEINKSEGLKKSQVARNGKKRIIKKIPAVTKVEECTSADTGVGAAIAAGSHAEKGI